MAHVALPHRWRKWRGPPQGLRRASYTAFIAALPAEMPRRSIRYLSAGTRAPRRRPRRDAELVYAAAKADHELHTRSGGHASGAVTDATTAREGITTNTRARAQAGVKPKIWHARVCVRTQCVRPVWKRAAKIYMFFSSAKEETRACSLVPVSLASGARS